ncbi:MAG: S46 family peptidase [Vicinamibacterales bacterium]
MTSRDLRACLSTIALSATLVAGVRLAADEGMWTFDNPPLKLLKERYGFEPTADWLQHVRLSSVRFNDGGSGSFISATGLVLTNHHVALGQLQKVSTEANNFVRDGFYAKSTGEEIRTPDLELNVLVSMENVTATVTGAVTAGMSTQQALDARRATIARLEKESLGATGLRSDVVPLYQGGEYWLYRYKQYTDVRIVFAPEQQAAFFGGDPDNFTYPRYDLDFAVFRVYENGRPATIDHFLTWKAKGAAAGELVFVPGHPGSTDRLQTVEQLITSRDFVLPTSIRVVKRRLSVLREYSLEGQEQSRQAAETIFGLENALKAWTGELAGLQDAKVFEAKQADEREFRRLVEANPTWKAKYAAAWDAIARAEQRHRDLLKPQRFQSLRGSQLAGLATALVKYATEVGKPDAERLDGFHDAQLPSLVPQLASPRPFYPALERALLADALQESVEVLGPDDPFVKAVVGNRQASDVARDVMQRTTLVDPKARKALVDGGAAAIGASTDPLLALARAAEPYGRAVQQRFEADVDGVVTSAGEQIGQARFDAYGRARYPDATFTLRLSYGAVKGYPMNGTQAPPFTTFFGLFDRAAGFSHAPPFNLPKRLADSRDRIDLSTPINFVSTNDIIGGNSGSPVINRQAELVGLIFDGNIESLVGRYVYGEETNRAVAVHAGGIMEALRKIYDAGALADEIEGKRDGRQEAMEAR